MDAAEIDDRPARADCAENTTFPDEHLLDGCIVRKHRQHHVGMVRKLCQYALTCRLTLAFERRSQMSVGRRESLDYPWGGSQDV